jgi:hypothetical protein
MSLRIDPFSKKGVQSRGFKIVLQGNPGKHGSSRDIHRRGGFLSSRYGAEG